MWGFLYRRSLLWVWSKGFIREVDRGFEVASIAVTRTWDSRYRQSACCADWSIIETLVL